MGIAIVIIVALLIWKIWPKKCPACKGFGELPPNGYQGYTDCPHCRGKGIMS